jgi:hypothetical protein
LERVFHALQEKQITNKRVLVISLDLTSVKARPDAAGALKKNGKQALEKSRGGLKTKIQMPAADNQCAIGFILSGGEASDAKNGRRFRRKRTGETPGNMIQSGINSGMRQSGYSGG